MERLSGHDIRAIDISRSVVVIRRATNGRPYNMVDFG